MQIEWHNSGLIWAVDAIVDVHVNVPALTVYNTEIIYGKQINDTESLAEVKLQCARVSGDIVILQLALGSEDGHI